MPEIIDGVRLNSEQIKALDDCIEQVKGVKSSYAVCVENFKKSHRIVGAGKNRRWVKKKGSEAKA